MVEQHGVEIIIKAARGHGVHRDVAWAEMSGKIQRETLQRRFERPVTDERAECDPCGSRPQIYNTTAIGNQPGEALR
jgi:hypothetical protein